LAEWIARLSPDLKHHNLVLLASFQITQQQQDHIAGILEKVFGYVAKVRQRTPDERPWPMAPNSMFRVGCKFVAQTYRQPFLWLEPDAVPLKPSWLDDLSGEYQACGKSFMGAVWDRPKRHMNGNGIYPAGFVYNGPDGVAFDVWMAERYLGDTFNTSLIHHEWGDIKTNRPWTFPDRESLLRIHQDAVLFHRCKDGSLLDRLSETLESENEPSQGKKLFFGLFQSRSRPKIIVRRTGAIGDAIAATCVASKLIAKGYDVTYQTGAMEGTLVGALSDIRVVRQNGSVCDIDLDLAYENHPNRKDIHFSEIFIQKANACLAPRGIELSPCNYAPSMRIRSRLSRAFNTKHCQHKRPWVAICPRSNSFPGRTIPDATWKAAAELVRGSKFWLGNHSAPPYGIINLGLRSISESAVALSCMDLLITVDTGPMHIGAALGVPVIAIEQASSPELHLSDQRDFVVIKPEGLDCLNCQLSACPYDLRHPPCQDISPYAIAVLSNSRLEAQSRDSVSAIMACHRPDVNKLNRSLACVIPQVDEVVVVFDSTGVIPPGMLSHPKIKLVKSKRPNSGYGRKVNFGVRHSIGRWLLLLNNDCYLDEGSVRELLRVAVDGVRVGVVGHLLWYPGRQSIQHGGTCRGKGDIGWGHVDHRKSQPSINAVTECENVTGASCLVSRKAFYDVLGMDERYVLYFEDNDFNLRLRKNGWKIFYTPLAQGVHEEHSETSGTPDMSRICEASRKIFHQEWGEYFRHNTDVSKLGNFDYLREKI